MRDEDRVIATYHLSQIKLCKPLNRCTCSQTDDYVYHPEPLSCLKIQRKGKMKSENKMMTNNINLSKCPEQKQGSEMSVLILNNVYKQQCLPPTMSNSHAEQCLSPTNNVQQSC